MDNRRNMGEFVAVAFVLALGINLLSTAIPLELRLSTRSTALLGLSLIFICVGFLVYRLKGLTGRALSLEGILALNDDRTPEEIDRYEFSDRLKRYFQGMAAENKAIAKIWRESPLGFEFDATERTAKLHRSHANALVLEAIEYFVLNKLSLHLSAYFDSERDVDESAVVRVNRRDIPQVLLENRFLELFSKPMETREAFMDHSSGEEAHTVVYATGKDGAFFDHFELVLPAGSKVERQRDSGLRIETSRFTLTVSPKFPGTATLFPNNFEELYLKRSFNDLDLYGVRLHVKVEFKWRSFLTGNGWDHYEWLDSFLDELVSTFHFDEFLSKIQWEAAASVAIALKNQAGIVDTGKG